MDRIKCDMSCVSTILHPDWNYLVIFGKSKIPLDTAGQRRLKRENGMVTAAMPRRRAAVFTGE